MKSKQTAVEYLLEQFERKGFVSVEVEEQAKQIEQQQIMDAFNEGGKAVSDLITKQASEYLRNSK